MRQQKTFGRKVPARAWGASGVLAFPTMPKIAPASASESVLPDLPSLPPADHHDDVDTEIAEWNALRKAKRRSFREPWRTTSIVAGLGFGLSSWLLPDSVSNIMELVTGGLALAAFVVGFRPQSTLPDEPDTAPKPVLPSRPAEAAD
jgi:hypothetical protein